jgi:hypothetical protein
MNNDSSKYRSEAALVGAGYFLSKISNTINELVSLTESIFSKAFVAANYCSPAERSQVPSKGFPHNSRSAGNR